MMNIQAKPAAGANAAVPPTFAANLASTAGGTVFSKLMADAAQGTAPKAQTPPAETRLRPAESDSAQAQRAADKTRATARDAARAAARSAAENTGPAGKGAPKEVAAPVIKAPDEADPAEEPTKAAADIDPAVVAALSPAPSPAPELSAWAAALTRTLSPEAEADTPAGRVDGSREGLAAGDIGAARKMARAQGKAQAAKGAPVSSNDDPAAADPRRVDARVDAARHASEAVMYSNAAVITAAGPQNGQAKALERVAQPASIGDGSALLGSQAAQGAVGATALPETLTVQVSTPADAPEFREALGVQVSLLARDGVQRAELHLNPAEMGPISVNIVMDGAQARVDFGADSATTRELIESGLPELAAALRDAGFTLAGGGVSRHSAGSQGSSPNPSDSRSDTRSETSADASRSARLIADSPAGIRLRMPNSAVDLYA